jgi:L-alanine-DL-glutamate epimerase-like enolase superfamily enzyme
MQNYVAPSVVALTTTAARKPVVTEGQHMKIVDVSTRLVSVPMQSSWAYGLGSTARKDELLVFVHTDTEISGVGVSYHGHAGVAVQAIVEQHLRPVLIGQDPLEVQGIWDLLFGSFFHLGSAASMAISGIDIALWDILAKRAELPLHVVLGGGGTTQIPTYVGCMTLGIQPIPDLVREAVGYAEQGYRALKIRGGAGVEADREAVRAVRGALPDIDIMVDANCAYAWQPAVDLARKLAEFDITWFEDPFDYAVPNHHNLMGRLAQSSPVAIASGGLVASRFDFQSLLEAGGCQYVTPDVVKCGGISEAMKIAAMASAAGILVAPHTVAGLAGIANAHFTAAIPTNARSYMEWDPVPSPLQTELMSPPPRVTGGLLTLPSGPGLGVSVNSEVVDAYPARHEKGIADAPRGEGQRLLSQHIQAPIIEGGVQ